LEAGFQTIGFHSSEPTGIGQSHYEFKLGPGGKARFLKRWGHPGVGCGYTDWEGEANRLGAACQRALAGKISESGICLLELPNCTMIVHDNDDSQTGRTAEPELVVGEFYLPVDLIRSLLDRLSSPSA